MTVRFLPGLLILLLALLVAACCGSSTCDCQDAHADSLYLQFDADTLSGGKGFRTRELDSVVLIRMPLDTAVRPTADTVRIGRRAAPAARQVLLEQGKPFARSGGRTLPDYTYSLYLPGTKQRFQLTDLVIVGDFEADACCTCYRNSKKTLLLDGTAINATSPSSQQEVVPIILRRKP